MQRGRDSNPRCSYPHTNFPGLLLQPLGHLSITGTQRTVKFSKYQSVLTAFIYALTFRALPAFYALMPQTICRLPFQ